jgi:hypothetical protein
MISTLTVQYSGFVVNVVGHNDHSSRIWEVGQGEYDKNLFATYMYRGRLEEYRTKTAQLNNIFEGEFFLNTSVVLNFDTYELFPQDTTWLCFSSYKPYTAEFIRLTDTFILPKGIGAYCVLGKCTGDRKTLRALNYLKPREYDIELSGDAKIILIKHGQFVK